MSNPYASLLPFAQQLHSEATAKGHNFIWNTNNPLHFIGRCHNGNCHWRVDLTEDGKNKLTQDTSVLAPCKGAA